MKKIPNILTYVLFAVTAVVMVYFYMAKEERVGSIFVWSYIIFGLALALLLLLPLFTIGSNPKALRKMAVSIGFIAVLFGFAYLLSSGAPIPNTETMPKPPTTQTLRIIDTGLLATYLLLVLALLSILGGSLLTSLRNR